MSDTENWGFETKQIHAGWTEDPTTKSATPPIYTSTALLLTQPSTQETYLPWVSLETSTPAS